MDEGQIYSAGFTNALATTKITIEDVIVVMVQFSCRITMDNYHTCRATEVDVGTPPLASMGWEVFSLNFHDFDEWSLKIYPGGETLSENGIDSVFL
mmetsp:Transcript_24485/g.51312  ORF Transcript_24485/g.51312 Transcript_24485/m.51312 type:complete len:96 (+) Transcript_24485:48-335(+)